MRIETDPKLDFSDVLIRPKRSTLTSRKEVDLNKVYRFRHADVTFSGVPIIAANMDHTGTFEMAKALHEHKMSVALHKHYSIDELEAFFHQVPNEDVFRVFYSLGTNNDDIIKYKEFQKRLHPPMICIDVANGYSERFVDFVKQVREDNPQTVIMAGNVVTGEMVEELILAGADIVKVGIGPGSVCTTRKMTGVGYPQLSAIIECADAAHGLGGHICADGGCTVPGDVAKAFGAGADFVMLGGMLAGHDECEGEKIYETEVVPPNANENFSKVFQGKITHMKFYGMSSQAAMEKYNGGVAEYRASEGKEVLVPYRGPVANTIQDILGGVRSACTYTGSKNLKELPKRTTFVLVHNTHNTVFGE